MSTTKSDNKKEQQRARAEIRAFDKMSEALQWFRAVCNVNKVPIRSVTFRVNDDDTTRLHVIYRRRK